MPSVWESKTAEKTSQCTSNSQDPNLSINIFWNKKLWVCTKPVYSHNNTSSSGKSLSRCPLNNKIHRYICLELFSLVLDLCIFLSWFRWDIFFTGQSKMMEIYCSQNQQFQVKNALMVLFLTNSQIFTYQDVNRWTVVVWMSCRLLWFFYQLFGLSFWRHPFSDNYKIQSVFSCYFKSSFHSRMNMKPVQDQIIFDHKIKTEKKKNYT